MNSITFKAQPSLEQLNRLISAVPAYPISLLALLDLARKKRQPEEVMNFYSSFGRDQVFDTPDDLQNRTEQVEMMRQAEKDMPPEQLVAPEEY